MQQTLISQPRPRPGIRRGLGVVILSVVAVGAITAVVVATGPALMRHTSANKPPVAAPGNAAASTAAAAAHDIPATVPSPSKPTGVSAAAPAADPTQLAVTLGGLSPQATLVIDRAAVEFTVAVTNPTTHPFHNITLVVSGGHCSCSDGPARQAPPGILTMRQPDGSWNKVGYYAEGTGMDYVVAALKPGFALAPGQTRSFTFRLGLTTDPTPHPAYHDGKSSIDVTMIGLTGYTGVGRTQDVGGGYTVLGDLPAASLPIRIVTG